MKIRFDNVSWGSSSGPNGFAVKLRDEFKRQSVEIVDSNQDVQLSFITSTNNFSPTVLRLDGIYYNTKQNWQKMNEPIKASYDKADAVIFQSAFNKELIFNFFGKRNNTSIIHNGTNLEEIAKISPASNQVLNRFDRFFMCASSWRPHKRLNDNIRFYLENKNPNDCLIIAGDGFHENIDKNLMDKKHNIFYLGNLSWSEMISYMKKSKYFIHLSFLDHCPNVVVDSQACGCHTICSSSGGTKEIVYNGTVIKDMEWDFKPLDLYSPPKLNLENVVKTHQIENSKIDIKHASNEYIDILKQLY